MNFQALRTLMQTHPQWPSVSDTDLLAWVNEAAVAVDRATIPSGEIFGVILNNPAEWAAMTDTARQEVRDILVIFGATGVPTANGEPARTRLVALLGTVTKQGIAAIIPTTVTRSDNAGVGGTVKLGHIEYARTL